MLSRANYAFVDQELQCGLIAALKKNQPDLYQEACRVLVPMSESQQPEAETEWEPYQGTQIKRKLYRTKELNGYLDWGNLRQAWLVVQETREKVFLTQAEQEEEAARAGRREKRNRERLREPSLKQKGHGASGKGRGGSEDKKRWESKNEQKRRKSKKRSRGETKDRSEDIVSGYTTEDGWHVTVEHRYFVSNVTWNRLNGRQILTCVRNHWAVENDCFHSLDVQWREDAPAWCTTGEALLVLGMLRILAYNVTQTLRKRHVREPYMKRAGSRPAEWRRLFDWIREALRGMFAEVVVGLGAGEGTIGGLAPP